MAGTRRATKAARGRYHSRSQWVCGMRWMTRPATARASVFRGAEGPEGDPKRHQREQRVAEGVPVHVRRPGFEPLRRSLRTEVLARRSAYSTMCP